MTHRYITDNTMQTRSTNDVVTPDDDNDNDNDVSNCSTPYVSAPSSPSNNHNHNQFRPASSAFFFYSAPSSPMHYVARSHLTPSPSDTSAAAPPSLSSPSSPTSFDFEFEFEFGSSFDSPAPSADELFLNGRIRPFKLHDIISEEHDHEDDDTNDQDIVIRRSREDAKLCGSRSQRRRTRSMSPLRSATPFDDESSAAGKAVGEEEAPSGSSSRCSSAGRSSKRWVFLKDFLRSKSEGRSNNKFWHTFSSPASKEKEKEKEKDKTTTKKNKVGTAAAGKRRSAHEMHYAANRAQAEEMRKKTFLPYRQGLLGCLGFNSKSYGALHGFARALNPVSSR